MAGEIFAGVRPAGNPLQSVAEAGAVVNVGGGIRAPGEGDVATYVERVALVMVEWAQVGGRAIRVWAADCDITQPSCDDAAALGNLVGIGEVKLGAVRDAGRAQGKFPSANQGSGIGEGKEDVGCSDVVVVEKVRYMGFESVGVEDPSAIRDGDTELMFFVALSLER